MAARVAVLGVVDQRSKVLLLVKINDKGAVYTSTRESPTLLESCNRSIEILLSSINLFCNW